MKNSMRFYLLKMNLLNQFKIQECIHGEGKAKKQRRNTLIIFFIVAVLIMNYSIGLAFGLKNLGLGDRIPLIAYTAAAFAIFIESALKINSILYGGKDFDILMSFPIKIKDIIFSKIDTILIMSIGLCAVIMLPMGIVYCTMAENIIIFWIVWIIALFVASILFVSMAIIISTIISGIVSKMKLTKKSYTLFIVGLMAILVGSVMIYVNMNIKAGSINEIVDAFSDILLKVIPGAGLLDWAVVEGNVFIILITALISYGVYYLCGAMISKLYLKNAFVFRQSNEKVKENKERKYSSDSLLMNLYRKEMKHYLSIPVYVFNSATGAILAVVFSIVLAFGGVDNIASLVGNMNIDINSILVRCGNFIIVLLVSSACTTYASISIEGDTAWIMKSMPILSDITIKSKMLVNLTVTVPTGVLASLILAISLKLSLFTIIINIITQVVFALFVAEWGIFINLKNINFEWTNEVQVIKQGVTSLLGILGGFVVAAIATAIVYLSQGISYILVSIIINLVMIVIIKVMHINNIKNIKGVL